MELEEKDTRSKLRTTSRRSFLQSLPATAGLPIGIRGFRETQVRRWNLLPFERAVANPVRTAEQGVRGDFESFTVREKSTEAEQSGATEFHVGGLLSGTGKAAMNGSSILSTTWTPPETGWYTISAKYTTLGEYVHRPARDPHADFSVTAESNLAVLNETRDRVIEQQTRPDLGSGSSSLSEKAATELLEFLAYRLVAPFLGILGKLIAKVIIEAAGALITTEEPLGRDPGTQDFQRSRMNPAKIEFEFPARADQTYNVQFTTLGGCSGKYDDEFGSPLLMDLQGSYNVYSLGIQKGRTASDDCDAEIDWEKDCAF